ncbi:hypothetical protein CANARDRAFT_28305 [[Candida] arabinofermentans NRRL YB-2248]|uniref:U three protein 23 n=1 Tax=[Candida] arabinofermentans NRRL YB-2248 TaxID=983967 RepID=A0A1E4T1A5_9ASCO|nr:hypothetical protein CANARDRAFT_28305 [[Candida] arabinofermentans NRRL YB-2248]
MKQKRAKAYRKQMHVYTQTFKFKTPIQTIADSEIILHAEKTSFDLFKGVDRTIQMESKMMITQCCINHLYETKNQPAIEIAKRMEKRRCGHKDTLSSRDCIKSIVSINGENKHRYCIVTQDEDLRRDLRKIPGVPLVYMNRSVMIMEPLSNASAKVVQMVEARKLTGGLNDPKYAGRLHVDEQQSLPGTSEKENETNNDQTKSKKRKGPKGPNPLSMKKKQTEKESQDSKNEQSSEPAKKKRRRSHKKSTDQGEQSESNGGGDLETGNEDENQSS